MPEENGAPRMHLHDPSHSRVLQLKDQAGALYCRELPVSVCPWNVAAGSPTLDFAGIPPLTSSHHHHHRHFHTCIEKTSPQSHHVFRAHGHISLPPVSLRLCAQPGRSFLRPGCPGCWPRGPPAWLPLA